MKPPNKNKDFERHDFNQKFKSNNIADNVVVFGCESSPISRNVRSSVSQSVSQSSNAPKRPSKAQKGPVS